METNEKLIKIGDSVMVSIPPQMLEEMGVKAGRRCASLVKLVGSRSDRR